MSIDFDAYGWSPVTEDDLKEIRLLLGRKPHPIIAIARRSRSGRPQVIVNDPLPVDSQGRMFPFPTLFWLVSPCLVRAVDRLESEGWIDRIRRQLIHPMEVGDGSIMPRLAHQKQSMIGAHQEAARLRLKLADTSLLDKLKKEYPSQYDVLATSGVAGLSQPDGVKCLHAHLADYLGRPKAKPHTINPIGQFVADLLIQRGDGV